MNDTAILDRRFPATPPVIRRIRREIARRATAAGFAGEALDDVVLAVSEAATNVVRHAYPGNTGEVELLAGTADTELWVIVADRGCGFQHPTQDPGLGHGMAVMAAASRDFVIAERVEGGTEVRLSFQIPDNGSA